MNPSRIILTVTLLALSVAAMCQVRSTPRLKFHTATTHGAGTPPFATISMLQGWFAFPQPNDIPPKPGYSDTDWQTEFFNLNRAGISAVVIEATVDESTNQALGTPAALKPNTQLCYYHSSISSFQYSGDVAGTSGMSPIDEVMKYAKQYGMKVYLGLNFFADEWNYRKFVNGTLPPIFDTSIVANGNDFCGNEALTGVSVANELNTLYGPTTIYANTFGGWYWPWEIDNLNFDNYIGNSYDQTAYNNLVTMLTVGFNPLSASPRLLSPYYNPNYTSTGFTAAEYEKLWKEILLAGNFHSGDILALQDGVGDYFPSLTTSQIDPWFADMQVAVQTVSGMQFWANANTYQLQNITAGELDQSYYSSAPMLQVIGQFLEEATYVSAIMSFSYSAWDDPLQVNSSFDTAWRQWYPNKTKNLTPPAAPTNIYLGNSGSNTAISWSASPNCGFIIWRDNKDASTPYDRIEVPDGSYSSAYYVDPDNASYATYHSYWIATFDVWGNQSAAVQVTNAPISSMTLNPTTVYGGNPSTGTVTIPTAAPAGGETIDLSVFSASLSVPSSVTIPAGQTSVTFTVTTYPMSAPISAEVLAGSDTNSRSANLTINPPAISGLALAPNSVTGATSSTGTVTLTSPAPTGGTVVTLSSTNTAAATAPSSVTVSAGARTAAFAVTTSAVSGTTTSTISGTLGSGVQSAVLTINEAGVSSVALNPASVPGLTPSTGTVALAGPAGPLGDVVTLTSNNGNAIVPATVTVGPGQTSTSFTVTTLGVTTTAIASISGKIGTSVSSANLTVTTRIISISVSPATVPGGQTSTGTVTLSGNAGSGGVVVTLTSSNACAVAPGTVTVPSGASTATFTISTNGVNSNTTATIAGATGISTSSASLTVTPGIVSTINVNPSSVIGGTSATGTLTLTAPAGPGGMTITIFGGQAGIATAPATVVVPYNSLSVSFPITTYAVSSLVVEEFAANPLGGYIQPTGYLTVNPPTLTSMVVSPTTVQGRTYSYGTATISGPAPTGGLTVSFLSDNVHAMVPISITIPAGSNTAQITILTSTVIANTTANISASLNGVTLSAALTITT